MFHFHNYMSILNPALVSFLPKFYKIKGQQNFLRIPRWSFFFLFFTIKHLLIKRISITQPISSPQKTTRKYCKITPFSIFGLYSWLSRVLNLTFKNKVRWRQKMHDTFSNHRGFEPLIRLEWKHEINDSFFILVISQTWNIMQWLLGSETLHRWNIML